MNVLSLFDGMACGMLAFQQLGIPIDEYYAYEIDEYAIKTVKHNFPNIYECGDVFNADYTQYEGIDYLIGGSPCTHWSIAQKKNRETEASGIGWELFSQYVRALREAKPKYFLYENNKSMSDAIKQSISQIFGFDPIWINASLVSAQKRNRYYWLGKRNPDGTYSKVEVEQPDDQNILLKDILESGYVDREKSYCLKHQAGNTRDYFKKHHTQIAFESVRIDDLTQIPGHITPIPKEYIKTVCDKGKIYKVSNHIIPTKFGDFSVDLEDGFYIIRKLTVLEHKRLQTVPDDYEFPVSDTQAYKMLGNGWCVAVISHLLQSTINN